ncbi:MAG: lysophospholipid acyltransferase family protein, partial [Fusobacterium sp.]
TPLDGPKGPKEKAKKGLLYLCQKTSVPLVPVGISYSNKWILRKTWDKFEIPKPFSKVKIVLGEAMIIDENEDLDEYTEIIENSINDLNKIYEG